MYPIQNVKRNANSNILKGAQELAVLPQSRNVSGPLLPSHRDAQKSFHTRISQVYILSYKEIFGVISKFEQNLTAIHNNMYSTTVVLLSFYRISGGTKYFTFFSINIRTESDIIGDKISCVLSAK